MRQIAVLSVALVASLVGAYLTWTHEAEEVSDDVAFVYSASENDLQKLHWKSDTLDITVERRKDDAGSYLWVESTETKKPKDLKPPPHPGAEVEDEGKDAKADEGKDAKADEGKDTPEAAPETPDDPAAAPPAAPEAPPEVKTTRFMANAQGDEMWKSFAPLAALRELAASGSDLATFGLDTTLDTTAGGEKAPATIEVVRGSGPISLTVGGETYGSKDRYVKYQDKVYLVDDATLRPLEFASSRLIERSLFPFQETDIEAVDVEIPGQAAPLAWVQQNRDDRAKSYWAKADALEKEDDTGGTWLGKVFKLKLREYVDEASVTTPLETVVAYTVKGKGQAWRIEIVKTTNAEGKAEWYAKSAYNRSLVSLTESLVGNVVDDLGSLTATE